MTYQQLITAIKDKKIERLYLIYGEEVYLMEEIITLFKIHLLTDGLWELNFKSFEGKELVVNELIEACETLPFMSEKKLILVNGLDFFQGKRKGISELEETELLNYFSRIPASTTLVFYGATSVDTRKKLYKSIDKYGTVIKIGKLKGKELEGWISSYFKRHGKLIGPKEIQVLISYTDYINKNSSQTLMDLENEIKKIISYMGDCETVSTNHIEEVSIFRFQNDIFKLLDSIGKKNVKEAIKRMDYILNEGETTFRLMATLVNQTRSILQTKLLLKEGYNTGMIASKIGAHPFVVTKNAEHSKGYSVEKLKKLLEGFLEIEYKIKSGRMNDRLALELMVIEACGD